MKSVIKHYTIVTPKHLKTMSDREIADMQQRIDQGIILAQQRLVERSRLFHTTLVVTREGHVVELLPEDL